VLIFTEGPSEHSSTSHRLFLPICLMYCYSLQIKMGLKKKVVQERKRKWNLHRLNVRYGEDSFSYARVCDWYITVFWRPYLLRAHVQQTSLHDVYLSDIYLRSQLRIYWCYFSLSSQHVSVPSGHPQVKHNLLLMYLEKAIDITTDPLFTICLLLSIYSKVNAQF
jgi:hypothetical protein